MNPAARLRHELMTALLAIGVVALLPVASSAQRLVLVDQDASGPGGSNQMALIALLQSREAKVLGITVVTGSAWRDEEVQHTLRMLELIGRTDVPVVPGAVFPLVRSQEETRLAATIHGKASWAGAWGDDVSHDPWAVPALREGVPSTKPLAEDAAHFLIRQVRAHPGEVTIYAGGPLTNIALALSIEPHFAEQTKGIVLMGGSLNPQSEDPDITANPRHEFNFWFDPEAAHIVLRAKWPRIDVTTVDVSVKAMFTKEMLDAIARSPHPAAKYIASHSQDRYYLWDELAACAWLNPSIITKRSNVYLDVDIGHGAGYGQTLAWPDALKPSRPVRMVHAQLDVDLPKFTRMFVDLMSSAPR